MGMQKVGHSWSNLAHRTHRFSGCSCEDGKENTESESISKVDAVVRFSLETEPTAYTQKEVDDKELKALAYTIMEAEKPQDP